MAAVQNTLTLLTCGLLLAACGRPAEPQPSTTPSVTQEGPKVVSCAKVPPVPDGQEINLMRDRETGTLTLSWLDSKPSPPVNRDYTIRTSDPTCADRPDIQKWIKLPSE